MISVVPESTIDGWKIWRIDDSDECIGTIGRFATDGTNIRIRSGKPAWSPMDIPLKDFISAARGILNELEKHNASVVEQQTR